MQEDRNIITAQVEWQGITLQVTYEHDWLGMHAKHQHRHTCHITVTSLVPERAALPITETGYLSHFLGPEDVDAAGGAVAYVLAWLDCAALGRAWRAYQQATRQLSLF